MNPQIDDELLNSIVAGVLDRLRGSSTQVASLPAGERPVVAASAPAEPLTLNDPVVTESLLEAKLGSAKSVRFAPKAVLTPTARDFLRVNKVDWAFASRPRAEAKSSAGDRAMLIVTATPTVERVVADLLRGVRTELLSCPDDAAALAIAEIARGGFSQAVIFTAQTHRAACLANRHASVKAVAIRDAADVAAIRKQLRANVWCIDPTDRGYFELRNILKALPS